jgi:hypothetical protein
MVKNHRTPGALLVLTAICVLLTGCFQSTAEFPLANAAAFGEGERYVGKRVAGDRFERQEVLVITRRADRAYEFVNEKGETLIIAPCVGRRSLRRAGEPGQDPPGYGCCARIAGNEATLYLPQCDKQDKAVRGPPASR